MDVSAPAPDLQDEVSRVTIAHGVEAVLARAQALENERVARRCPIRSGF